MSSWRATGPIAYGIDFGTTNSSIAVAFPGRVEVVPVESGEMAEILPSIVYLHRDRNRAAGREAVEQFLVTGSHRTQCAGCELVEWVGGRGYSDCRQYRPGGGCLDARLISGLKSELSQKDFVSTHSWALDFKLADLVAVIMRRLKSEADRLTGADVRRVVLGHPVAFAGTEGRDYASRQATAEERLQRAAADAGFEEVALLEEPAAAVIEEPLEEGIAVAADFGGGTFDVAVIRFAPDGGDVVALTGAEIGGEQFDQLLFQAKVAPALHLGDQFEVRPGVLRNLPNGLRKRLATPSGLKNLLSDPDTPLTLREFRAAKGGRRLEAVEEILYSGYGYQFYRAIEDAKIALSTRRSSSIEFHRPRLDLSIPVTRSEFEGLIASRLEVVRGEIMKALELAEIGPEEVSLVLRTGGSSSIPAFVRILEEVFDPAIVQERPVYTTVVHGLASYAQELWR
jgi:hypothetical chaperone protein